MIAERIATALEESGFSIKLKHRDIHRPSSG
jgi:hypothetical protein